MSWHTCTCGVTRETLREAMSNCSQITQNLLPLCFNMELTGKDTVKLYGKLYNTFLYITSFQWTEKNPDGITAFNEAISKLIKEILLNPSNVPNIKMFADILNRVVKKMQLDKFSRFCVTHFMDLNSCININLIEPVEMLEKKILQHIRHLIHATLSIRTLKELITLCPTVDLQLLTNDNQQSVLHVICMAEEDDLEFLSVSLKELPFESLQRLINLRRKDDGNTALHLASKNGKRSIVQYLLEQGARTPVFNSSLETALDVATNDDIRNIILKAESFNASKPTHLFTTLLTKSKLLEDKPLTNDFDLLQYAINSANVALVEDILKRNPPCVLIKNDFSVTPLIKAVGLENVEIVRTLLQYGADDSELYRGMNALHYAVKKGNVQVVDVLLHYIDVNVQCEDTGQTPLHMASENGNVAIVKLLLAHGANFKKLNYSNKTPFDISINNDVSELLTIISDLHDILSRNFGCVEDSLRDIFMRAKRLNSFDAVWNAKNKFGETAAKLVAKSDGLPYHFMKKLYLCAPKPPEGS